MNSDVATQLLYLLSDFRDVIDEEKKEEANKLFEQAYELIAKIE